MKIQVQLITGTTRVPSSSRPLAYFLELWVQLLVPFSLLRDFSILFHSSMSVSFSVARFLRSEILPAVLFFSGDALLFSNILFLASFGLIYTMSSRNASIWRYRSGDMAQFFVCFTNLPIFRFSTQDISLQTTLRALERTSSTFLHSSSNQVSSSCTRFLFFYMVSSLYSTCWSRFVRLSLLFLNSLFSISDCSSLFSIALSISACSWIISSFCAFCSLSLVISRSWSLMRWFRSLMVLLQACRTYCASQLNSSSIALSSNRLQMFRLFACLLISMLSMQQKLLLVVSPTLIK